MHVKKWIAIQIKSDIIIFYDKYGSRGEPVETSISPKFCEMRVLEKWSRNCFMFKDEKREEMSHNRLDITILNYGLFEHIYCKIL